MKRALIALAIVGGVALSVAPAQGQGQGQGPPNSPGNACPPGQTGNNPYCQVPPPNCGKKTAKMSLARATYLPGRQLSILAPITTLASGQAQIELHAAGTRTRSNAPIDSDLGRIRTTRPIRAGQAALGTGILTITYNGDADTRPQVVRLRAANNRAKLAVSRPTISSGGVVQSHGTVSTSARGVVRVQLEYVKLSDGKTVTLPLRAKIKNGSWRLNSQLSSTVRQQIAARCGTVHSYTLFTGYLPRRIRGEMRSYEVLPAI